MRRSLLPRVDPGAPRTPRVALPHRALAALLALFVLASVALAGGGPSETVVLVNGNSAESRRVAEHYAKARRIPPAHLVEVKCAATLETPMADFVRDVVEPLRQWLRERAAEDRIRFVVITHGMPIRAKTASGAYVSTTAALALLHTPLCGAPQLGIQPPLRSPAYDGAVPLPRNVECARWLHVTALLASTADEAIALVDRSVASDGTAPKDALFVFQDANGPANTRNAAYDAARGELEALGAKTEHVPAGPDKATLRKRVMGYMAGGAYSALTPEGVKTNEYLPGALSDHLQSFGAVPQNFSPDGKGYSQFPILHMVRAGITGVHGAVQEPYTLAFPDADLFTAYVQGATLAETFDARLPLAYWMNLVLGDPLCAPYAVRPKVTVERDGASAKPWSKAEKLRVAAPGAKRIDVHVDGVWVAGASGAEGEVTVETGRFADGPHQVLVEARGEGAWEPRGWTELRVDFANPELRGTAMPSRIGRELRVPLSRAPRDGERPSVTLTADGIPVPGKSVVDGAAVVFRPDGALPADGLWAKLEGTGGEFGWAVRRAAGGLSVECAPEVAVGEEFLVRVRVEDGGGAKLPAWRGRVEVRLADPPIRLACVDAVTGADATAVIPLRFGRPGTAALRVTLPEDGLSGSAEVLVHPGAPAVATSPQDRVPIAQPFDLEVHVLDALGNRAEFEGELRIAFPGDPAAVVPPPVAVRKADRGRVVFRDVVLTKSGRQALVISDGDGKQWSREGEGVVPVPSAIRAWLATAPVRADDPAKLARANPAKDADRDGETSGGRKFQRLRARGDAVEVPSKDAKDGDVAIAAAFVDAASAVPKVRLLGASAARLVVLVDGKVVFDGVPTATDPAGKRAPLAEIALARGPHRVTALTTRKDGRAAFSLELDDGAGKAVEGVTIRAEAGGSGAPKK